MGFGRLSELLALLRRNNCESFATSEKKKSEKIQQQRDVYRPE